MNRPILHSNLEFTLCAIASAKIEKPPVAANLIILALDTVRCQQWISGAYRMKCITTLRCSVIELFSWSMKLSSRGMTEHSPHPVDWKNPCNFAMALAGAQGSRTVILYLFWVPSAFKSADNVSCARTAPNIFSSCFNLLSIADRRSNGGILTWIQTTKSSESVS